MIEREDEVKPRSAREIFNALRDLAQTPGSIHEISVIVYRDWVVTVDIQEARVTNEPEHRWSTEKLNKNEILLLVGLAVQSQSDLIYSVHPTQSNFSQNIDRLLREFHDHVLVDLKPSISESGELIMPDSDVGPFAREAIYYGAESFYLHQFAQFARNRYREDADWLQRNVGLSIRPMLAIAHFICKRINDQMTAVGFHRAQGREFLPSELTDSLIIAKEDLLAKFGTKAALFLAKFATPATNANLNFDSPFSINQVAISPLIDIGEFIYVPNQYRLMESIYESPFYWMMLDKTYRDIHSINRGRFLEGTTAHILTNVFGAENVHRNVLVGKGKKKTGGEIDTLVVYGEFVIVAQAKSKRVTAAARAGDTKALERDFADAIQAPFQQALECIAQLQAGEQCVDERGLIIQIPKLPRFFPLIVLSDPFPSATLLSDRLLQRPQGIAPIIWDIGVLDCVTRILPTPIEMLFFLQSRAEMFESAISDSEYNFLGYHLRAKLTLPKDADGLIIDRDFATAVDDYMIAHDLGLAPNRPRGVLERLDVPVVSEILDLLRAAPPEMAGPVIDFYDFSYAALEDVGRQISMVREEVRQGKALKAFSILTRTGGFTFAAVRRANTLARDAAHAIGRKHKYDNQRDRWYIMLDDISTDSPIDGLLALISPWVPDQQEAELARRVDIRFKTRHQPLTIGAAKELEARGKTS